LICHKLLKYLYFPAWCGPAPQKHIALLQYVVDFSPAGANALANRA
jgi:hypothetical protein